ncbi:MAG TPA: transglutaminase-like domain-containing protein [Candidatus Polarisedimenticolia bacterium]|nr:transglutaminase-like domain-containing protein [Candidatus Polarisedimenticolia bacterium]
MTTPHDLNQTVRRQTRRRIVVSAALVMAAGLLGWVAQSEIVFVTSERNGEFPVSSYTLREDDFHHPRLQLLRSQEKLDEVVSGAKTQFEKIVSLRAWTRRQWEQSGSFYYPPWDAVEILRLARKYGNRGFCAQYAVVFLQACQSLGLHARYVDLPGHFVVAVWSDDYNRWVLMDPTYDINYERNGVPMRGRDLYRAYWKDDLGGIVQVDSKGNRKTVTRDDLSHYRLYSIGLLANQLSEPIEVKSNGLWRTLVPASNYRTYPKVGRDQLVITSDFLAWRSKEAEESFPERPETGDQDDFRYALNQTVILLANERLTNRILKVALLSSNSPTFERFLVRSESSTDWVPATSATFRWMLHSGTNELSARIETSYGWRGNVSSLRMFYKPPLVGFLPSFRGNIFTLTWHRSS